VGVVPERFVDVGGLAAEVVELVDVVRFVVVLLVRLVVAAPLQAATAIAMTAATAQSRARLINERS
jgi:hypothetical protein